jgi:hypothetical protein
MSKRAREQNCLMTCTRSCGELRDWASAHNWRVEPGATTIMRARCPGFRILLLDTNPGAGAISPLHCNNTCIGGGTYVAAFCGP